MAVNGFMEPVSPVMVINAETGEWEQGQDGGPLIERFTRLAFNVSRLEGSVRGLMGDSNFYYDPFGYEFYQHIVHGVRFSHGVHLFRRIEAVEKMLGTHSKSEYDAIAAHSEDDEGYLGYAHGDSALLDFVELRLPAARRETQQFEDAAEDGSSHPAWERLVAARQVYPKLDWAGRRPVQ